MLFSSYMRKENIRIMCMKWNYLLVLKRWRKYSLRVDPFRSGLSSHPSILRFSWNFYLRQNSRGKMVKMANIVPLIIYLLIYISFLFCCSFLHLNKKREKCIFFVMIGGFQIALRLRLEYQNFHKLETTQRLLIFT